MLRTTLRHPGLGVALSALLTAALLLAAGASSALAGDTRNVIVASPGQGDGVLTFSEVTAGGVTKTDIVIDNQSSATMNKTTLTVGIPPAPTPLAAGVTVVGAYGPNGNACTVAADGSSATCSFGNVRSGTSRAITLAFAVTDDGTTAIGVAVKVKETVNDNGANKDTFEATGAVAVGAFSCNDVATFVVPGKAGTVSTADSRCDPQSTDLTVPALAIGALVRISEVADDACVGNLSCFGLASDASVNDGAPVNLTWAITWNNAVLPNGFNVRKAGVIHFEDDGDEIVIANDRAGQCGNSPSKTDCIVSVTQGTTTTTIIFRTPSNGRVKGFG